MNDVCIIIKLMTIIKIINYFVNIIRNFAFLKKVNLLVKEHKITSTYQKHKLECKAFILFVCITYIQKRKNAIKRTEIDSNRVISNNYKFSIFVFMEIKLRLTEPVKTPKNGELGLFRGSRSR